ncbi:1-deoxy-D-xylulose-5-phosphate synthase [Streptomyces sp. NPDC001941]|uniref:1-deoxy-D-xylulose-5-phosphate synthase n=1 Tax=Streptomyces sp. NPDC001941 TaxID=3154659 RepID=UPI003330ED8A
MPAARDILPALDIPHPERLRTLNPAELAALAGRIRGFLVEHVTLTGGHLGPNLGVVELTLALHRVFDSPREPLLFDTGHQTYVHKVLTGRGERFPTLRQAGGLSGYPSRAESAHDWISNSHASTVLSYADGLAAAREQAGDYGPVVAVIGDGALTGGMAYEALNNLGTSARPVVVVVNDNGRSYAPTTGGVARHLAALRLGAAAHDRNLFTDLGFRYLGPVDGHDVEALEAALRTARAERRAVVVHAVTVKGRGHLPAEQDGVDRLHAVNPVRRRKRKRKRGRRDDGARASWTDTFADALLTAAHRDSRLVALTAAMLRPSGLHPMRERYPQRVFDVGIAEQHAVTSAAGMAMAGLHPVVAIYATFLNRAFDQVLMDVALHRLPVTFVLDRAGVTGPDGPSHHGLWDLALLANVPHLRIAAPRDATRLRELLTEALADTQGPTALRYPRGTVAADLPTLERCEGGDIVHRSPGGSSRALLVAAGPMAHVAVAAAGELEELGLGATVVDPRWVLPARPGLAALASRHRMVVTVEDGLRDGGMGTAVAQLLQREHVTTPVVRLGLPPAFLAHGEREELLEQAGLSAEGIANAVLLKDAPAPAPRVPTQQPPRTAAFTG